VTLITLFSARYLATAISDSQNYSKWVTPMMLVANWESPFGWVRNMVPTTLQGLQYGITATVYRFGATFVAYMAIVLILHVTDKTNMVRLMYTMPLHGAFAAIVGVILVILH
jgi:hypothetical protein